MSDALIEICIKHVRSKAPSQTSRDSQLAKFIMLCGKNRVDNSVDNRSLTNNVLQNNRNDVFTIYSEDLFTIIEKDTDMDLLKFEEILVEISDGIILFLESMGSATELGSFAYLDGLAKKMLVFVDKRYEKCDSFINGGPVKKIIRETKSLKNVGGVEFTPYNYEGNIDLTERNYERIKDFIDDKKVSFDRNNLYIDHEKRVIHIKPQLFLYFVIDLVYVYELIEIENILDFMSNILSSKSSKYTFNFEFDTNNKFRNDKIFEYILAMLKQWDILKEVVSTSDNTRFIAINFSNLFVKDIIANSFGKILFNGSLYSNKDFIKMRLKRKKNIEKNHGKIYEKRFASNVKAVGEDLE